MRLSVSDRASGARSIIRGMRSLAIVFDRTACSVPYRGVAWRDIAYRADVLAPANSPSDNSENQKRLK